MIILHSQSLGGLYNIGTTTFRIELSLTGYDESMIKMCSGRCEHRHLSKWTADWSELDVY